MFERTSTGYRCRDASVKVDRLSHREAQLLVLSAVGLSFGECAEIMGIALTSVRKTAERLYWKLDVSGMVPALAEARRLGFLSYDGSVQ